MLSDAVRLLVDRVNQRLLLYALRQAQRLPEDVLLNLSLDFEDALTSRQFEETISRMEVRIKPAFPEITRVFIEAQSMRVRNNGKLKLNDKD